MKLAAPKRPTHCVSDLEFDRLFAGESSQAAKQRTDEHVATCERCSKRYAELLGDRTEMLLEHPWQPPSGSAGSAGRRSLRTAPWAVAGLLAAAACALLVVRTPEAPGVRLKGGPRLGFFVQRNGYSEHAESGYTVRPGERVRFVYSNARPSYLAIYGVDVQGRVSRYFPESEHAALAAAGADVLLDSSIELDGVLGPESVYAVFCDAPFVASHFEHALQDRPAPSASDPHCSTDTLSWTKEREVRP